MQHLIHGFLVGIVYVAPIGTQNLFVINTSLTQPRLKTLFTALIVMFFDISLSLACFFGVGALTSKFPIFSNIILLLGSLIVIWMGLSLLFAKSSLTSDQDTSIPLYKVTLTACAVTWLNPQALIDGTVLFGGAKALLSEGAGYLFISGAALASAFWWLSLSSFVGLFKDKITPRLLRFINIACGSFIIYYGLKLLYGGIKLSGGFPCPLCKL